MEAVQTFSQRLLAQELGLRQRKNPSYSMRAFSRFIELPPPVVCEVINGKRGIPKYKAEVVAEKLQLSPKKKHEFIQCIRTPRADLKRLSKVDDEANMKLLLNEENHFKVISEWEHFAILSLVKTKGFRSKTEWIAERLGISIVRADDCVRRLLDLGLLVPGEKGKLTAAQEDTTTTIDVSSAAIQKGHMEALDIAKERLVSTPVKKRDYSSNTIEIDTKNIERAKVLILEFRRKISKFLSQGKPDQVYQISMQLFPLSKLDNSEGNL